MYASGILHSFEDQVFVDDASFVNLVKCRSLENMYTYQRRLQVSKYACTLGHCKCIKHYRHILLKRCMYADFNIIATIHTTLSLCYG